LGGWGLREDGGPGGDLGEMVGRIKAILGGRMGAGRRKTEDGRRRERTLERVGAGRGRLGYVCVLLSQRGGRQAFGGVEESSGLVDYVIRMM